MDRVLSNAEMRAADAYTIQNLGISPHELMKRAGLAIADEVEKAVKSLNASTVLVVCGTGNNGGDGYVCAAELLRRGIDAKIYAFEGELSPDCKREKEAYNGAYSHDICGAIIVDCIFGTGLSREITGKYAEVISKINGLNAFVISADIPSGISGDNGSVCGVAVKANKTVAIAEYKAGMFLADGLDYCGKIVKKDIGIVCPQNDYVNKYSCGDMADFYPKRRRNSHKGTYGSANIIAGSDKYIGAAALATEAALMSGCGYVKLTTAEKVKLALAPRFPQTIFLDDADFGSNAIAVGMGCGVSEQLYKTLGLILKNFRGTLVMDADGLNTVAKYGIDILKDKNCEVILTPHLKEFSRLCGKTCGEILQDPINIAKELSNNYGVTLVLKNSSTIICGGGRTAINTAGNTALSKGGSGDTLSGYLCGTLARGLSPFDAAVCACFTLGLAAEIAAEEKTEYCATARDVIKNLHFAVKRLTRL